MKFEIIEKTCKAIENRKARSAWDKGVKIYALDLITAVEDRATYEGRTPADANELREWMMNGAKNWKEYSYGGCALICDEDIAETLCTPSELKRKRGGELQPNSTETWLDVQARALYQASRIAVWAYRGELKKEA